MVAEPTLLPTTAVTTPFAERPHRGLAHTGLEVQVHDVQVGQVGLDSSTPFATFSTTKGRGRSG